MISIQNVSKSFQDKIIFDNVSLTLEPNKKYLIVGPNGVGKSIFLKLITGLSLPQTGSIHYPEGDLHKDFDFPPFLGLSTHSINFIPSWSGYDNLHYLSKVRHKIKPSYFINLAKSLNLSEADLQKKVKKYSEGMTQKLRIIQALMESPKYLILDEPFNALDKESVGILEDIIQCFIKKPNHYVIMTSHTHDTQDFADVILEISNHTLIFR